MKKDLKEETIMKLGGIGYGLISGAILGGIVNIDLVNPEFITISDKFDGS